MQPTVPANELHILPAETLPAVVPLIPDRIVIPKIELDAPVIPAVEEMVEMDGVEYLQFLAPDEYAAGWHTNSASLGEPGNTVLNGHHNVHGEVFGRLVELNPGDKIYVYSGSNFFEFLVSNVLILKERDVDLSTRLENARWIEPSDDVRLTLVTCWPEYTNTHRLIIVASPAPESDRQSQPR
jgi:LPXTG-site transpeptidase (sortase) family protein